MSVVLQIIKKESDEGLGKETETSQQTIVSGFSQQNIGSGHGVRDGLSSLKFPEWCC